MALNKDIYQAILDGNAKKAHEATEAALASGAEPMTLIQDSMVPAMDEIGKLFKCEEYFVPELLLAGRAMKSAMGLLKPVIRASGQKLAVRVIIGTVMGDLHEMERTLSRQCSKAAGSKSSIWERMSRRKAL